jgi:hypothetical protein
MVNPIHDICSTHLGLDFLIPWWSKLQSYILAILFRPFKFLAPKDFYIIWLSNIFDFERTLW